MSDLLIAVLIGTALLLMLGFFMTFMLLQYQKRRFAHRAEVQAMHTTYKEEVLKARLEMQEQTVAAISREIHDNIGQVLALARLHLGKKETAGNIQLTEHLHLGLGLLDQALLDLRDLSKQLRADLACDYPLSELLQFQLQLIGKTGVLDTQFEMEGRERHLAQEQKLILVRIVQELLHNTLKHAEAGRVGIHLCYLPESLLLTVQDNGRGFIPDQPGVEPLVSTGIGTRTMHERAQYIGATLHIESKPAKGTTARLAYHFKANDDADKREC